MEVKEKVINIIADILEVQSNEISLESSVGDFTKWDSLGHLAILQNVQDEFEIEFEPEEIIELEDVADIIKIVEDKLAESK